MTTSTPSAGCKGLATCLRELQREIFLRTTPHARPHARAGEEKLATLACKRVGAQVVSMADMRPNSPNARSGARSSR